MEVGKLIAIGCMTYLVGIPVVAYIIGRWEPYATYSEEKRKDFVKTASFLWPVAILFGVMSLLLDAFEFIGNLTVKIAETSHSSRNKGTPPDEKPSDNRN